MKKIDLITMAEITREFKLTEIHKQNLRKTFENLESQSSSILFLALQWKDVESHFDSIKTSISRRHQQLISLEESLRNRLEDVKAREERAELTIKSVTLRFKELESREVNEEMLCEEREMELQLMRVSVEERSREVDKVRVVVEQGLKTLDLKEKLFRSLEKSVDEKSKELESVRNLINESFKELELREKRLKEVDLREKQFEVNKMGKRLFLDGKDETERLIKQRRFGSDKGAIKQPIATVAPTDMMDAVQTRIKLLKKLQLLTSFQDLRKGSIRETLARKHEEKGITATATTAGEILAVPAQVAPHHAHRPTGLATEMSRERLKASSPPSISEGSSLVEPLGYDLPESRIWRSVMQGYKQEQKLSKEELSSDERNDKGPSPVDPLGYDLPESGSWRSFTQGYKRGQSLSKELLFDGINDTIFQLHGEQLEIFNQLKHRTQKATILEMKNLDSQAKQLYSFQGDGEEDRESASEG